MHISFEKPENLIMIPICILLLIFIAVRTGNLSSKKKKLFLIVRGVIVTLIITSLAGFQLQERLDETTTIFAVDRSYSMDTEQDAIKDFIREALGHKGKKDHIGVLGFGEKAMIEQTVSSSLDEIRLEAVVNHEFTNIEEGLKVAGTMIPEKVQKRIVLISDGKENIGDALTQGRLLKNRGVQIDVLEMNEGIQQDVQVTSLLIPKYLNKMQYFDMQVQIYSLMDTEGYLKIYNGNQLIGNQKIHIKKGENRFVYTDQAKGGGSVIYGAEVEAEQDTVPENNKVYGYGYVEDIPRVLLISEHEYGKEIQTILANSDVHLHHITPEAAPTTLETFAAYDTIILANVSAADLGESFLDHLEEYVRHLGGGLVVTGGENAYGLGGYKDTLLEKMLPVNMDINNKSKLPNLGLIILTDRSGSMGNAPYGISKLELAKEAAIRSVEALNPLDYIGVIAFDDQPQWIVEYQTGEGNKNQILRDISGITVGGGTSIIPGLEAAVETLKESEVKLKHIIMLTDGQAEQQGYESVISSIQEGGITLSTVAVGADADTKLLAYLADQGNGRYYYTDEFSDLPRIFMKETMLASKNYVNTRMFYPTVKDESDILKGIESTSALQGYIATTPKEPAQIIMTSDREDPILATWQYGLGKTAAWTSDMHNQWTREWLGSEEGVKVFRNIVSWTLKRKTTDQMVINSQIKGNQVEVTAQIKEFYNIDDVIGTVVDGNGLEEEIQFQAIEPGKYTGAFDRKPTGAYILHVQGREGEKSYVETTSAVNIPFSSEYDIQKIQNAASVLKNLAMETGGIMLNDPSQVFRPMEKKVYGKKDVSQFFLSLAFVLFLIDIAVRRFPSLSERIFGRIEKESIPSRKRKEKQLYKKEIKQREAEVTETTKKDTTSVLIHQKKKRMGTDSRQNK